MTDAQLVTLRKAAQAVQELSAHTTALCDALVAAVDALSDEPLPGLRVVPGLDGFAESKARHPGYTHRQDWDEGRAEVEREKDRG